MTPTKTIRTVATRKPLTAAEVRLCLYEIGYVLRGHPRYQKGYPGRCLVERLRPRGPLDGLGRRAVHR